jgi:hypothetical protein
MRPIFTIHAGQYLVATRIEEQTYFAVTKRGRCWQTRELSKADDAKVCSGEYESADRDFTKHLNVWPFQVAGV